MILALKSAFSHRLLTTLSFSTKLFSSSLHYFLLQLDTKKVGVSSFYGVKGTMANESKVKQGQLNGSWGKIKTFSEQRESERIVHRSPIVQTFLYPNKLVAIRVVNLSSHISYSRTLIPGSNR